MRKKLIWLIVSSIITLIITACWNAFTKDSKELTICEERQISVLEAFSNDFIIYTKDSIKLEDYHISEYSITNTGNITIVGTGIHSDLLVDNNKLQIASDSILINLYRNDAYVDLVDNHICFKQIRPGEKITLLCVSKQNIDNRLICISDRDIKDTDIVYTKRNTKLTTFEETTSTDRWISVGLFLFNLSIVLVIVSINYLDMMKGKSKGYCLFLAISFLCLIYTLLLPIRWLL